MSTGISVALRLAVTERAANRCEYCRLPDLYAFFSHEPDHIISEQHGGETTLENLALACMQCNRIKGPNIASVDPESNSILRLFNPRVDRWEEHFKNEGGRIIPLTPIARATARLLDFNDPEREEARKHLFRAGQY